jgi:hypothetical protein
MEGMEFLPSASIVQRLVVLILAEKESGAVRLLASGDVSDD